jgi:hypothetical protein
VLWRAAYDGDADAIRDTLLSLVPTYRRLGRGPAG